MLTTYEIANAEFTAANQKFSLAQKAYRAREIGDAEFLAARAEWKRAEAAYDASFATDASRSE